MDDRRFTKGLAKWTTDEVITCGVRVWANVLSQVLRGGKKTASYTGPLSLTKNTHTHNTKKQGLSNALAYCCARQVYVRGGGGESGGSLSFS